MSSRKPVSKRRNIRKCRVSFSVVIPAYNGQSTIAETIQAILSQSCAPREVIVVDDGLTDGTRDVLKGFGASIVVLTQAIAGVQAARNLAVSHSKADWLAFCDQDDLWQPTHLAAQSALLRAAPEIGSLSVTSGFSVTGFWMRVPNSMTRPRLVGVGEAAQHTGRHGIPDQHRARDLPISSDLPIGNGHFEVTTGIRRWVDTAMRGLRNEDGELVLRCLYRGIAGALPEAHVLPSVTPEISHAISSPVC